MGSRYRHLSCICILLLGLLAVVWPARAAELQLLLPLNRVAYQTNEQIDLSVIRSDVAALPASELALNITGEDGSTMAFTFPLAAVAVDGNDARATEHLHLNGRLLRPGKYTVVVTAYGATAQRNIEVYSHVRKSSFRLLDWGSRAQGAAQAAMGEDNLGFNLLYGSGGTNDAIRGGVDYSGCCVMGGGHQMDLRMECDWSDPYVLQGAEARVTRAAMHFRTTPNAIGVHFYDEPGLTWWKDTKTGEMTPHNIPTQDQSFKGAFGVDPLLYNAVKPDDADSVAKWMTWGRWKESFMEAAWKCSAFGVSQVRPDYLSFTQSVYGWSAYSDGYYYNVVRALPIMSGHGGYDDFGWGYFNPSYTFEFGRMRDLNKPNWYLPTWYGNTPSDLYRLEQYLSFMMGLQGMGKPPDMQVHNPSSTPTADGIVETNKLMGRLGTIFTTMPVTRPEMAVLYSMSQNLHAQIQSGMQDNYTGGKHAQRLGIVYLASKMIQTPLFPIVEEDVLDGTLAAHHKVVLLTGINYLDPKVITALENYSADGGVVLLTDDCLVQIKGAVKLGAAADVSYFDNLSALYKAGKREELAKLNNVGGFYKVSAPVAAALKVKLRALGILPVFDTDNAQVAASRQAFGDIEYLFAVNAAYDTTNGSMNAIKPTIAAISLPADGRPVYDAMCGGSVTTFAPQGQVLSGQFRFGPGQMRVFARTARPIGGVQVSTPTLFSDYTVTDDPLHVKFTARLVDEQGVLLAGSAPLEITVTDSLQAVRYHLYRATDQGTCVLSLPLAVNDSAGKWTVTVKELLNNTVGETTFTYAPPAQCGALAGATPRAVYFGNDREQIFRFFRTQQDVTIVKGSSDYNTAAADRLAESLKPWGVRCTIVNAAEVNKPRTLTEVEAKTWVGLTGGTRKVADANINNVGFAVNGPVILLGTPEDNPLISFAAKTDFLPYTARRDEFPGRGHGYLAWQRDAVTYGAESITCIAYDAAGMSEAVGTLYEAAAGLDPLTPLVLPATAAVTAAKTTLGAMPALTTAWQVNLPDGVVSVKPLPNGQLAVLVKDGSLTCLDAAGKQRWQANFTTGDHWTPLDCSADGNLIAVGAAQHVLCYDSAGKLLFDKVLAETKPTITAVTVAADGKTLAVAGADGQLAAFDAKGKRLWITGGVSKAATDRWNADMLTWQAAVKVADEAGKAWDNEVKLWEATPASQRGAKPNKPKRPAQPLQPKPDPYYAGTFSPDGNTLYACTAKEAHAYKVASGAKGGVITGIDGTQPVVRMGDRLLLTDGANKLRTLSLATGKISDQLAFPAAKSRIISLTAGDGIVVATDVENAVRYLKGLTGPLDEMTTWSTTVTGRIVKRSATRNSLTALAYWGGQLQILDANGKVIAAQALPQDVATLTWWNDTLVIGLADGRVLGMVVK